MRLRTRWQRHLPRKSRTFQPLDEVRDEIRRTIAEAKVTEQLSDLMRSLETEAQRELHRVLRRIARCGGRRQGAAAAARGARRSHALAKENNLVYQKTDPATWQQLRDTTIGNSTRPEWGGLPFYAAILNQGLRALRAGHDPGSRRESLHRDEDGRHRRQECRSSTRSATKW